MHTGCQWYKLPIDNDEFADTISTPRPRLRHSRTDGYKWFFDRAFESSVAKASEKESLLDTSVMHGDGTTTAAKKRGDILGSGP